MINYTIRPVLWLHKKDKDGLHPLKIAVTIKRKVTYSKTPFKLSADQWNGQIINYANAKIANAALRKLMNEMEARVLELDLSDQEVSVKALKHKSTVSFSQYAKEIKGNTRASRKEIKRVVQFHKSDPSLSDLDTVFLRRYEQKERERGMSPNTINTTFKWLRKIINQAYKERRIKVNPFENFTVPKYVQTDRTYLTDEEKNLLIGKLQKGYPFFNTLCYSLFSCYTGLRHQDWQRITPDRVDKDHFRLRANKNKQLVVIPIGPTLRKLIKLVFSIGPPGTLEQCNRELKLIAKDCGIKKNLTCHVMRHSFAYMCAKNRAPRPLVAELMGISERVVSVYFHLAGEDISEMASFLKSV